MNIKNNDPEGVAQKMSTYTQIIYHIIFTTKNREPSLIKENREKLFRYIWGFIKHNKHHLYRINGVEDHLHILISLHPMVSLSDFVRQLKITTSKWIKENNVFPQFTHWQEGYGAFTHSVMEKDGLIEYIKGQEEHHKKIAFIDELRKLLLEAKIDFDEKYLT
jgi:REP element-mobilizing transposase RayT